MAKAQFHRNQKVWVDSVGAWATIERIVPTWARGFDEPVRITYDLGLGREFHAHELRPEDGVAEPADGDSSNAVSWRLMRARNKWQQLSDCAQHPFPGTFPVVVTDKTDWGGWRVPGAEYDRDPRRIEFQARLIAEAPRLLKVAQQLRAFVGEAPEDAPGELQALAELCGQVIRRIEESPAAPAGFQAQGEAAKAG
jgi:hypothetical protein